ncbi:MAG: hypothetical protein OHK0052_22430 [Anaerolineales bacterium]
MSAGLVITLTLAAVVLINVLIILGLRNRAPASGKETRAWRSAGESLKSPFNREQAQLDELARRLAELRAREEEQSQ